MDFFSMFLKYFVNNLMVGVHYLLQSFESSYWYKSYQMCLSIRVKIIIHKMVVHKKRKFYQMLCTIGAYLSLLECRPMLHYCSSNLLRILKSASLRAWSVLCELLIAGLRPIILLRLIICLLISQKIPFLGQLDLFIASLWIIGN